MTVRFVKETAATGHEDIQEIREPRTDEGASTRSAQTRAADVMRVTRPGLLIAGLVLSAALTSGGLGATGAVSIAEYTGRKRYDAAESSTTAVECDPELLSEIRELFEQGASEFFQDGVHSAFSRTLLVTLAQHGRAAFRAVAEYLFSGDANPDVVSEALRWLADLNDPSTFLDRWSLLQCTLNDRSPRVRDGAILGFATLDDPRALPILLGARDIEQIVELRRLIDKVIEQLNATTHAAATANGSGESLA